MIRIAASSDIHSPKYLKEFENAVKKINKKIDLFLLAGDLILKGSYEEINKIINILDALKVEKVISVFGNEEYDEYYKEILKISADKIIFLNDELITIRINEKTVGIIGSKGSLDEPTYWQLKNLPNIEKTYSDRINKIEGYLKKLKADFKILLTHYAPTYLTLEGEKRSAYSTLGCKRLEPILKKFPPDIAIHGHSHVGKKFAYLGAIPIYNVAFPLRKSVTFITLPLKGSLLSYF